jgi:ribonuclease HI
MHLFTDGSADPKTRIGYGCYLCIPDAYLETITGEKIDKALRLRKFFPTSSTHLEVETLLWALTETAGRIENRIEMITVYSDSQTIINLPERRSQLQLRKFKTKTGNKDLTLAKLYQDIFKMLEKLQYKFVKLAGHSKKGDKNRIEQIFMQVDRSARKALRQEVQAVRK